MSAATASVQGRLALESSSIDTKSMADDWLIPDKKIFLEQIKMQSECYFVLEYKNRNPQAPLQRIELTYTSTQKTLIVHFNSSYSEAAIKAVSNRYRVTMSGENRNETSPQQYISIPIGSITEDTFLPIEDYLRSKGFPLDLLKDLRTHSFFKNLSDLELKFYSALSKIGRQLDATTFQQLFTFATTFFKKVDSDNRFSQAVCSDLLYRLGEKCFETNLFDLSYKALEAVTEDNAYYYAAQFLMGKCLWATCNTDNSDAARVKKKQAFTHFYFASLEVEEAEGFIRTVLANLCDTNEYNPAVTLISSYDTAQKAADPVRTIISKFLHLVDVCYQQSKKIAEQQTLINKLILESGSGNTDPNVHALSVQFNTMNSQNNDSDAAADDNGDGGDSLKHKKRAVQKVGTAAATTPAFDFSAAAAIQAPIASTATATTIRKPVVTAGTTTATPIASAAPLGSTAGTYSSRPTPSTVPPAAAGIPAPTPYSAGMMATSIGTRTSFASSATAGAAPANSAAGLSNNTSRLYLPGGMATSITRATRVDSAARGTLINSVAGLGNNTSTCKMKD